MFLDDLFTLVAKDTDWIKVTFANEIHPVFQAHFPSNPVLPGFVHLEIISRFFDVEIRKIKKAKFIDFVVPSQEIEYIKSRNKYLVMNKGKLVASFTLEMTK